MTTQKHLLFLCPHAAAKSVLAMVYFQALAAQAGLQMTASNAGTEPDVEVNTAVAAYLHSEGYDLSGFSPALLTEEDLQKADIVVSMGCLTADQIPADTQFIDWSDVPLLSQDFQVSRDMIFAYVSQLVRQLGAEDSAYF